MPATPPRTTAAGVRSRGAATPMVRLAMYEALLLFLSSVDAREGGGEGFCGLTRPVALCPWPRWFPDLQPEIRFDLSRREK